jgi:hypothetical protein
MWFRQLDGNVEHQSPRIDRYLHLPGSTDLNIKLRKSLIEIKRQVGDGEVVQFHVQAVGVVESWRKWSFELAEPSRARLRATPPTSSWIAVRKERQMRTYAVQEGEEVVGQPAPGSPAHGCELELTRVRAAGATWWTLALEAFGDESTLRENLLLATKHVFNSDAPLRLEADHSEGYAGWLARLVRSEAQQ